MGTWAIGIDFGGTAIKSAVVAAGAGVLSERRDPTDTSGGPEAVVSRIAAIAASLYRGSHGLLPEHCRGVGIGAPAAVCQREGTLRYPPNLPGWTVYPLRGELQRVLREQEGIDLPVVLENDANAAAFGESVFGAGQGFRDFLLVTLGTGVGGGIIEQRKLYRGGNGSAGEIGFMIVDFEGPHSHAGIRGSLESLIGKRQIGAMARRMMRDIPPGEYLASLCGGNWGLLSPRHLEKGALRGDRLALAVWDRVGSVLGVGLANVAVLMDIRKFVIGGGISAAGELITRPALRMLHKSTPPAVHDGLEIVRASLGNMAGVQGAAALCMQEGADG